jgi:hypothetical protein
MLPCVLFAAAGLLQAATPSPSPKPSPASIVASIAVVVERLEKEREDPCRRALAEGRPCFPVATVIRGTTITVRDTLRDLGPPSKESPNRPPTAAELAPYLSGAMAPAATLVSFDPGCVGKSVLKALRGKNDRYFLYRLRDTSGTRVELYPQRLDATHFQGEVELLGEFHGECDAVAAWNRELRR